MSKDLKIVPPTPTPSISHWPSQKKVQLLADDLDNLIDEAKKISWAKSQLGMDKSDAAALKSAKNAVTGYVCLGYQQEVVSGKLCGRVEECDFAGWFDEDGDVHQPEVAKMIAKLVGSFPTSNVPDPAIFVRLNSGRGGPQPVVRSP
jgi:hypothetical protein